MAQPDSVEQTLFKPATVAKRWDCSVGKIYGKVRSGELESVWLDGDMRITLPSVLRFESRVADAPRPKGKGGRPPQAQTRAGAPMRD